MKKTNRIKHSGFRLTGRRAPLPTGKKQPPDKTRAAMERMELYCMAHPGSPSAVRRPRLLVRDAVWIALLGPSIEDGIAGFGNMVEAALRAFDAQYIRGLQPPEKTSESSSSGVRKQTRTAAPGSHRFFENGRFVSATATP